jgi:thiol-disulfide isomerase/thioredoxin
MDYKHKYLKYKQKYINLQNQLHDQVGGKSHVNTLNLFKADWCVHCIAFKDTWETLQNNKDFNIKYKTYDADKNANDIKNWQIQGYPTLILQIKDKAIEYVGPKTHNAIVDFIKEYS